jgi:hypothetical protein
MATVDELIIAIKADTKDLNKKLDKTNKQLKKTGKEAKKSGKNIGAAFSKGKVAVVAFSAVMVKMVTVIAKVGMEFEDLKDSLDVVFGSMKEGDKAMKRVFEFASTTPFQVETATKAFIALRSVGIDPTAKMLQTFADTASVSVDQLGTFEALVRTVQRSAAGGLGLEELNMLSDRGIPALKILSEELGLTKDDIAKFGKTVEGATLITTALQEGLEKRFGGAMENKMDNLSTKTSNMTIAFKQLADEVFKDGLGDFLKDMADALREMAEAAVLAKQAASGRGSGVGMESPVYTDRMTKGQRKQARLDSMQANINARQEVAAPLRLKVQSKVDSSKLDSVRKSAAIASGVVFMATEAEIKQLDHLNIQIGELTRNYDLLIQGRTLLSDQEKTDLMRQGELQNSLTFITSLIQKDIGATDQLAFAKANLTEIFRDNEDALLGMGYEESKIIALLDEHAEKTEKVATFSEEMEQVIISTSQAFANDFVKSLLDGEDALESFKNFAKNMVSQIIAIFLQMTVINQILNAIFDAGLSTYSFGGTGGGKGKGGGGARSGGGTVQKGVPTMVGERGAEIFVPNTGGTIMNNMNSKGMGGGTTVIVNQSVNFATGVVPTVRAEVTKMMPMISDVTKGAVLEAAVRGGSFKKGLMGSG